MADRECRFSRSILTVMIENEDRGDLQMTNIFKGLKKRDWPTTIMPYYPMSPRNQIRTALNAMIADGEVELTDRLTMGLQQHYRRRR